MATSCQFYSDFDLRVTMPRNLRRFASTHCIRTYTSCFIIQLHKPLLCRPATRPNERIYFRLSDVLGAASQAIALNAEVSYVMVPDPRGNQDRAANVQVLSDEAAGDHSTTLSGHYPAVGTLTRTAVHLGKGTSMQQSPDQLQT